MGLQREGKTKPQSITINFSYRFLKIIISYDRYIDIHNYNSNHKVSTFENKVKVITMYLLFSQVAPTKFGGQ